MSKRYVSSYQALCRNTHRERRYAQKIIVDCKRHEWRVAFHDDVLDRDYLRCTLCKMGRYAKKDEA